MGKVTTINAQKLRIGNIVHVNNPKYWPDLKKIPLKVKSISEKQDGEYSIGLEHMYEHFQSYSQLCKFLYPVKVTEPILMKCDFEKIGSKILESYSYDIRRDEFTFVSITVTVQPGNVYVYLREGDVDAQRHTDSLITIFNGDRHGTLTLDWLQNTVYDLSMGEKILTLRL